MEDLIRFINLSFEKMETGEECIRRKEIKIKRLDLKK